MNPPNLTLQEYAKRYFDFGWNIIPLFKHSKNPASASHLFPQGGWLEYQKRKITKEEFNKFFIENKPTGVGLITGKISGVVVVDEDSYKQGGMRFDLDSPLKVKTASGGKHYYFRYEDQVKYKFDAVMTGQDYLDFKFADKEKMSDQIIALWEKQVAEIEKSSGGKLYIREVPAFSDVSVIRRVFYELKSKGVKIDVIFIDHLPNMKPVQKAYGENNEREKVAAEVKELARELNVPVVIPTQAATQVEEKQMKGKRANKLDVYGSKAQIHHANTFFIITFLGRDNKDKAIPDWQKDVFILADVKKNRDGPCFSFKLRHMVKCGRMEEVDIDPFFLCSVGEPDQGICCLVTIWSIDRYDC